MVKSMKMKKRSILAAAVVTILATGCSKKDSAEHFAEAEKFIQQQNYPSAVIELKSAVQQAPDNMEYRIALGRVQLKQGDLASAAKEFERAIELGAAKDLVAASLFRSYYGNKDYPSILTKFVDDSSISPTQHDFLDLYRALVEADSDNTEKATEIFTRLSQQQRNADVATYAEAALQINSSNFETAIATLGKISEASLLYADSLFFKARLQQNLADHSAAIATFRDYLKLMPRDFGAQLMMTQSLVNAEQFDDADKELAFLLKTFPEQPFANFLKSIVLYERKDFTGAKNHAEKAINNGYTEQRARLIAALSSLNLNLETQALVHLDAIKGSLPANPELEALYASLLLKAGRADEVSKTLLARDPATLDYRVIAATSYQLMKQGSSQAARTLIEKYESTGANNPEALSMLATVKLGVEGLEQQGLAELEKALKLDPTADSTRIVLAQSYIRKGEFAKADALAEQWINNPAQALVGYNLKAYINLLQNKLDEASKMLELAQKNTPNNPFTLMLQAMVAARGNDLPKSAALLKQAVEVDPNYVPGLSQYYAVSRALNDTTHAVKVIEDTFAKQPDNPDVRILRASVQLTENKPQATIDTLTGPNVSFATKPPLYWTLLMNAHAQLNNSQQVLAVSRDWMKENPDSIDAELSHASALAGTGDYKRAIDIIDKHLKTMPNEPKLLRSKASYQAEQGDFAAALATIELLGEEQNKSPQIMYLKGRLLAAAGQHSKAIEILEQSYKLSPNAAALSMLADLIAAFRSPETAAEMVKTHLTQYGDNPLLQAQYANFILAKQPAEAIALYEKVLTEDSTDFVALNNYAWLLSEQNKLEEAAANARRALRIVPNHPDVLDTYGKILLKQNKLREAEESFEKSLQIRPNHPEVQLHYAEALIKSDQKNKGLAVLSTIQTNDPALLKRKAELENSK